MKGLFSLVTPKTSTCVLLLSSWQNGGEACSDAEELVWVVHVVVSVR